MNARLALLHMPGADNVGSPGLVRAFVALLAVATVLYFAATRAVLVDGGGGSALALVLGVALLLRLPPLLELPFLSSDLYRYVWDGRVQLAGINPYRYVPADPALAALRDHAIFDHVNRRFYAPTIYPPAAQLLFRLIAAVSQTALAAKVTAVVCEMVGVFALLLTLSAAGLPRSRVLIYPWNPLAAWSFAGNGHVDAEAAALIAAAITARTARRDGRAGALLAGATRVKFLPPRSRRRSGADAGACRSWPSSSPCSFMRRFLMSGRGACSAFSAPMAARKGWAMGAASGCWRGSGTR